MPAAVHRRHAGVTPAFDVAADAPDGAVHVLDDVGAGERAPEFRGQAEPRDREDLVDAFQGARGDARRLAFEPASEIPDQLLGLLGVVQLPGLAQRLPDRDMEVLGQALDNVAGLVNLAALDRRVAAESLADRLGERLGAVDDEEAADAGIEAALDQVVEQRLDRGGVLGSVLDDGQLELVARRVDPDGAHQDQLPPGCAGRRSEWPRVRASRVRTPSTRPCGRPRVQRNAARPPISSGCRPAMPEHRLREAEPHGRTCGWTR